MEISIPIVLLAWLCLGSCHTSDRASPPSVAQNLTLLSSADQEGKNKHAISENLDERISASSANSQAGGHHRAAVDETGDVHEGSDGQNNPRDETEDGIAKLLKHLLHRGYDKRFRPHFCGEPVFIACSIFIGSISSVSELDQDYTIDFYFRQYWDDHRLSWNATDNQEVNIAFGFNDILWIPDTFFPTAKMEWFHWVTETNAYLRVSPHGHVRLSIRLTITANCQMDFHYFPLDHQRCSLQFQSYLQPVTDLIYGWSRALGKDGKRSPFVIAKNAVAFESNVSGRANLVVIGFRLLEKHTLDHDGRNHSCLLMEIYFARNIGYYVIQAYLPAILMQICSWVSFWLPRHSEPARVTLGITTVLAMVTLRQDYDSLPKISYLKAIDVYMLTCLTLCLVEFVLLSITMASRRVIRRAYICEHQSYAAAGFSEPNEENTSNETYCYSGVWFPDLKSPRSFLRINKARSRVNFASRIVFPVLFIAFNIYYWDRYTNTHFDDYENDPGFIRV